MSKIYVDEIRHSGGAESALTIDNSGRVQIKQNNTATVSAPASGSLVLSGIPNWANKITLVTHDISMDTVNGFIRNRVTVGGSAITTAIYKYTLFRIQNAAAAVIQDEGSGDTSIVTDGFGAADNLFNYILTFYKVDDYIYKFNGTHYNQQYPSFYISLAGSIETSGPIDGFDISATTGNLDNGKARAFWE